MSFHRKWKIPNQAEEKVSITFSMDVIKWKQRISRYLCARWMNGCLRSTRPQPSDKRIVCMVGAWLAGWAWIISTIAELLARNIQQGIATFGLHKATNTSSLPSFQTKQKKTRPSEEKLQADLIYMLLFFRIRSLLQNKQFEENFW